MSRTPLLLLSLFVATATLAESGVAEAYCLSKACDTEPSYGDAWDEAPQPTECVRNEQGCYIQGTPLFWRTRCLTFGVQRDGSAKSGIDFQTAEAVIQSGFDTWAAADCGGGETPSFRVVPKGEIVCSHLEYNQNAPNANVFLFRESDWPYRNLVGAALALTTVTYNVETAEIFDADVELNGFENTFSTAGSPTGTDLASVVTHEIGHVLALSHSEDDSSVMAVSYRGGISMRTLTQDDIDGICTVYPPGENVGDSCGPRHGFSRNCETDEKTTTGGCQSASQPNAGDPRLFAAFGALAAAVALGRIRQRRAAR